MQSGFSAFVLVIWILMIVSIFRLARITPWRPLRIAVSGFGILLAALSMVNLVVQLVFLFRRS